MVQTEQIYCEDCMETMHRMDDKSIDIILTSPPYNTGKHQTSTERAMERYEARYDVYQDRSVSEYIQWCIDLFNVFDRILVKNGVILWNVSYGTSRAVEALQADVMINCISDIIRNTPFSMGDKIVWKKSFALPNNVSHNSLTRICEDIFVFARKTEMKSYKANKKVVGVRATGQLSYGNMLNFIEAKNTDGTCPLNRATFSSDLVCKLLDLYAYKPGLVVYDPFIGTGTTAVGCERMLKNLHWIGSEMSKDQCEWSMNRLKEYTRQQTLPLFAFEDNTIRYDKTAGGRTENFTPKAASENVCEVVESGMTDPIIEQSLDLGLIFKSGLMNI